MEIVRLTSNCISCLAKAQLEKYPKDTPELIQIEYKKRALQIMADAALTDSAPMIVYKLDKLRLEMFGSSTDYSEIKHYFNDYVMKKEQRITAEIKNAEDPLLRGIQYAMTGNYIDFGAMENVAEDKFEELLNAAKEIVLDKDEYEALKTDLCHAKKLIFLHDNCGEVVFDHILIKTLKDLYPDLEIISIVRGFPVLNDATMEDAVQIGLNHTVKVLENGSMVAGTCLDDISEEALLNIKEADLVISKGQGNFETLYGCGLNIYYLFMCKCSLFANRFQKKLYEGMLINDKSV